MQIRNDINPKPDPNFRKFGPPPHRLVLVHGGPGAAGSLELLARRLSLSNGVIDAYQTGHNIDALQRELFALITRNADTPVILLGHSWGAWLSLLFAGSHPDLVRKLILVATAPLEEKYVPGIMETRMHRLCRKERDRFSTLVDNLESHGSVNGDSIFSEIALMLKKADAYDASEDPGERVRLDYGRYRSVWQEAEILRSSGELLTRAGKVRCPVLAIHGDYDPHPADGVSIPLQGKIKDLRFVLLERCGHEPWKEKQASERFFNVLQKELTD